jgi:hypothetical protein
MKFRICEDNSGRLRRKKEETMDKWEYKVVRAYGGVVMLTNGQEVGKIVNNQPVGQLLYEYLNELGKDGWDVAGMAETRGGIELVLKHSLIAEVPE